MSQYPSTNKAKLTEIEKNSALWLKLRAHLIERRDAFRRQNDNNMDETKTAILRGRIQELNYILSLEEGDTVPFPVAHSPNDLI